MTSTQWRKIELRLRHLLRKNGGMAHIVLVESLDGTMQLQVLGGKTEVITATEAATSIST